MLPLYPYIRASRTHQIPVDDQHEIYVEESGTLEGIPVIVVHGGPGSGSHPDQRRFFDPSKYRIILFDQRGCGKSTPFGELENNTTQHLLADMEKIRQVLEIEKWVLFGGSWGSTLSLLYAQQHPDKVIAMILRSILLANKRNQEWFFQYGASRIFPDAFADFIKPIPENERDNIIAAYYKRLNSKNELECMAAAKAWSLWHRRCSAFHRTEDKPIRSTSTMRLAMIELHYLHNQFFIKENQIIEHIDSIKHVPATLVHSRYDMVCPLDNAFSLQAVWPNSILEVIRDAGHASTDPAMADALVRTTDTLAKKPYVS